MAGMAGKAGHGRNSWKGQDWLEMAGNGYTWLETTENSLKWLDGVETVGKV